MVPDVELVARANRGDIAAFGTLVERYQRSVMALALAELGDLHAAEDVAQSTMLLAYRRLATLRNGARFGPWLLRIARRQVVELARTRRVAVGLTADSRDVEDPGTSRQTQAWGEYEDLLSVVTRLPQRERVLVGLRYFDGHSMSQIAEITGRPVGSVTKQLSRAVARMRAWCEEESP